MNSSLFYIAESLIVWDHFCGGITHAQSFQSGQAMLTENLRYITQS